MKPVTAHPPVFASVAARAVGVVAWVLAAAAGVGQACTLAICAVLGWWGSVPTVVHRVGAGYDVAAWRTPAGGVPGSVINGVAAVSIIAAVVLGCMSRRCAAIAGRSVLAAWGLLFAWRFGVVAFTTGDGVDLVLFGLCVLTLACQIESVRQAMTRGRGG